MSDAEKTGSELALVQLTQQLQRAQGKLAVVSKAMNSVHTKNGNLEIALADHQVEIDRLNAVNQQLQTEVAALKAERDGKNPAPLRACDPPAEAPPTEPTGDPS